jgi:hypothetical protein
MNDSLNRVLTGIEERYKNQIGKGSRHYLEVSIGKTAKDIGCPELLDQYENAFVVVPLNAPQPGMKVRIDGRTFVEYAEYESGIALPGFIAKQIPRTIYRQ